MAEGGEIKLEPGWKAALSAEFDKEYFKKLSEFVRGEYSHAVVYPPPKSIFRAFELTPFNKVKVVILGQDPYHGAGQANGLSFAVGEGVPLPPSLQNIFKELKADLGEPGGDRASSEEVPKSANRGNLERWANQGVLLLNATLTVRAKTPTSHSGKGWEEFTDAAIKALNDQKEHVVFILWGNYAKQKGAHIDRTKHLVIESAHPSPLARGAFFGSRPFSKTNAYLEAHGKQPIDWL
jgi:uracil-DNA glycosylase